MKINTKNICKKHKRLSLMRQELEDSQLKSIKEIFSQQCFEQICQSHNKIVSLLIILLFSIRYLLNQHSPTIILESHHEYQKTPSTSRPRKYSG
jgi:hypothetical protein